MTNGKIWLVVSPNVGIPLFLTAVVIGSFAIHYTLFKNTTWLQDYYNGQPMTAEPTP